MSYSVARSEPFPRSHAISRSESIGTPTVWLAVVITSLFYCLPLGRYSVGGIASDFRIYDFILGLFLLLVAVPRYKQIRALNAERAGYHRWAFFLIVLVWISLTMTFAMGGAPKLLPGVLRSYRFSAFLLLAVSIVAIADTPRRWRFLLAVFYANICIQALLACAQGFGVVPPLWPKYWQEVYWGVTGSLPVGTLSPHHKHIGVVMMIGVAMSSSYLRIGGRAVRRGAIVFLLGAMLVSIVLAEVRTAWMGIVAFVLAYVFTHKGRAVPLLAAIAFVLVLVLVYAPQSLTSTLEASIEERMTNRIDRFGFEGIAGDRLLIWKGDLPDAIDMRPYILITGAGFQNVQTALGSTGAHNNYLQALLELGFVGFLVFCKMLFSILGRLNATARTARSYAEEVFARDTWALFIGIMATMLVGETLWGQYSMFTLSGQIMTIVGLATCPFYINRRLARELSDDNSLPARK